jgi:protein gp37
MKMGNTKIDWATKVWNPTTGCTKVSQGCKNCYAERMANRFWNNHKYPGYFLGNRKFTDVLCHPERLDDPLHWRKPQRVFVGSMSDLFHPDVPDGFIYGAFMRMVAADQHIYIILTKRPERMLEWITTKWMIDFEGNSHDELILSNVWLGVSVEDQATTDERIPLLLQTPAAARFVSYEPALGPVNLKPADLHQWPDMTAWMPNKSEPDDWKYWMHKWNGIQWVICGCESGPGARPMDIEWARSVRDQCQAAQVPFFFKQKMVDGKLIHMPELDGQIWAQFPEVK